MQIVKSTSPAVAITGIYTLLLTTFVLAALWVGQVILIPLALASLLTFLIAPFVARLERWIGRIAAVLLVVFIVFSGVGTAGYVLTRQAIDLMTKLPDYKANIQTKLRAFHTSESSVVSRAKATLEELKKDLPGGTPDASPAGAVRAPQPEVPAVPVMVVSEESPLSNTAQALAESVVGALGSGALVLLLVVFMLLKREDLRGRLIRLIGQGHISATTRAMEDAGQRVSRYLFMQLIVNVTYGIPVAIGLYFIGVPNAVLWGSLSIVLRFIPYIGPWVAAAFPMALSLAVSTSWTMPLLTLGLFLLLELISNNVMEPWLYGSSTGVSSMALILAAVLWTWLWGTVGLVLATPLTVCLVVMGRHIPKLQFLSVLLSDEQALAPHEECYHRMLGVNSDASITFIDKYLSENSATALYDAVLVPVLTTAELDCRRESLDAEQLSSIQQNIREIVEDIGTRSPVESKVPADQFTAESSASPAAFPTCRVVCLPARADRDQLVGAMLTQLLVQHGFTAENCSARLTTGEAIDLVERTVPDAVCISVLPPSTIIHARYLCLKLRQRFPSLKIAVGLWGSTEGVTDVAHRLRASGADEIVVSLAEAVVQLGKFSAHLAEDMTPAPIPTDEEARLAALQDLEFLHQGADPVFDRITTKLSRIFDVPIALVTLIDSERQIFKAQTGLPDDLAAAGGSPRSASICGHVVAANDVLVVEDLARDLRFANNPLVKERGLRFYAGVPLRAPGGHPIGSICIIDRKPRQITEREKRLLQMIAEEVMEDSRLRPSAAAPAVRSAHRDASCLLEKTGTSAPTR